MNTRFALGLVVALYALGIAAPIPAATGKPVPVIVELFTSEGCSSCPPADAVLSGLTTRPISGAEVIPLGEHVDYWNHGGWADPFSSALFSQRQSDYSRTFGKDSVYTPQMVVDGKTQFVGSDAGQAREAILAAARAPKAEVRVRKAGPNTLFVQVSHLPGLVVGDAAEVVLAVTEDGLVSSVGGGENSGRRLRHSAVVRRLIGLGQVSGGTFTAEPSVSVPAAWREGRLHAVVFVQRRSDRHIIGAAQTDL